VKLIGESLKITFHDTYVSFGFPFAHRPIREMDDESLLILALIIKKRSIIKEKLETPTTSNHRENVLLILLGHIWTCGTLDVTYNQKKGDGGNEKDSSFPRA